MPINWTTDVFWRWPHNCACPERSLCEWHGCDQPAAGSIWQCAWPAKPGAVWPGRPEGFKPLCREHMDVWHHGHTTRIPGLDPPERADEYWRPSMADMIRHAMIAEAFEKQKKERASPPICLTRRQQTALTPQQIKTLARMHEMQAALRNEP